MTDFNQTALSEFKRCKDRLDAEVPKDKFSDVALGTSPEKWFCNFQKGLKISGLSEKPLSREKLLELIKPYRGKKDIDEQTIRKLIISVFAWGGMSRRTTTGKSAIETICAYEHVCLKLLNGMSSTSAYEEFYKLRKDNLMKGMGPPFYTKLIFFFGDQSGLIMDQWTARSSHLLLGKKFIKLNGNRYVSQENPVEIYDQYLKFISKLSDKLKIAPKKTEELIFSCSHKHLPTRKIFGDHHEACSAWRKYVAENT